MSLSLQQYLEGASVEGEALEQTLRYYIAEIADDPDPEEVRQLITSELGERITEDITCELTQDDLLLENACLLLLSGIWTDEAERARVQRIMEEAGTKLPVIEIAIIVHAVVYGLYLWRTGGVRRSEKTVVRRPDGSFQTKEVTEYTPPGGILEPLSRIIRRN